MRFPYSTCIFLITTHRTKTPICNLFVKNPIASSYYLEHTRNMEIYSTVTLNVHRNFKVYFEFRLTNKPKKITTVTMGSEDCSVAEIRNG